MSPKSKRGHASKSKSKSRTVKKGGFWPFSSSSKEEPKFDGVAPDGQRQTSSPGTSANNTSNSSSYNPFSGVSSYFSNWGAKQEIPKQPSPTTTPPLSPTTPPPSNPTSINTNTPPPIVQKTGGKKRSKKSRKSKKHGKTNKRK